MKYTKEQLQEMSDLEINKALAVLSGWHLDNGQNNELSYALVVRKHCDGITRTAIDYCNNWNDVMPLAIDHGISSILEVNDSDWTAYHELYIEFEAWESSQSYSDKNPLRAIACCLVLVLQDKQ